MTIDLVVTPSRLFLAGLLGWLTGLFMPIQVNIFHLVLLLLLVVASQIFRPLQLIAISSFFLIGAGSYFNYYLTLITPDLPYSHAVRLSAIIFEPPTKYDTYNRYTAATSDGWRFSLNLTPQDILPRGTAIELTGTLVKAAHPDQPNLMLTSAKDKIFAKLRRAKIISAKPADLPIHVKSLLYLQNVFDRQIEKLLPEPMSSLLAGLLFGARSGLPTFILDNFKTAGLSHLIAVSGFNVTVVIGLFSIWTKPLAKQLQLIATTGFIGSYVIFTGASASVVRAGILAGLILLSRYLGRPTSITRLLIVTATIMSIHNPLVVRYDIGFQLSFAAVLGLIYFSTPFEKLLLQLKVPSELASVTGACTAAQITTLPIILFYFGNFTPYAILANLLVEPIIPLLTIIGLPMVLISFILFPVVYYLMLPISFLLKYIIIVSALISGLPYSEFLLPSFPLIFWISYYSLLCCYILTKR